MLEFLKELLEFLAHRKKLWLLPLIILFLIIGILVILTEGSVIAPLIYTLF
jgi:uncharacterized protein DUF5989